MIKIILLAICWLSAPAAAFDWGSPSEIWCNGGYSYQLVDGDNSTASVCSGSHPTYITRWPGTVIGYRVAFNCVAEASFTWGAESSSATISSGTVTCPATQINTFFLPLNAAPASLVGSTFSAISGSGYLMEIEILTQPYDAITYQDISGLLENTTIQAVVTEISAASDIADFLTFKNVPGGIHKWLWGAVCAIFCMAAFSVGLRW